MAATLLKYLRTGTAHVDQVEEKDANDEKNEGAAQAKAAKAAVIITDYHLEERTIKDDEYIVPTV
jgi:single-stranded DNA-specific DHH superfamily exonuclease